MRRAAFIIGEVGLGAGPHELEEPLERQIARFLMYFGGWELTERPIFGHGEGLMGSVAVYLVAPSRRLGTHREARDLASHSVQETRSTSIGR